MSGCSSLSYRMQLQQSSRVSSTLCSDTTVTQRHTGKWLIIKLIITYLLSVIIPTICGWSARRVHLADFDQLLISMPFAEGKHSPHPTLSSYIILLTLTFGNPWWASFLPQTCCVPSGLDLLTCYEPLAHKGKQSPSQVTTKQLFPDWALRYNFKHKNRCLR